jgi:hypothetical protein
MKKFFLILFLVWASPFSALPQDSTWVITDTSNRSFLFPIGDGSASTGSITGIIDKPKKFKLKPYIAPAVCIFIAGASEGFMDALQFHYDRFKRVFPGANDQFWYPDISWQNRRGEYIPFVRDGWHTIKFIQHTAIFTTIVIRIGKKRKWYWYAVEGLSYWAINRAGFHLTYNIIFKR